MATHNLIEPVARCLADLLQPGDHVAVANPTDPAVLEAIVACGASYVDAGRDHEFRIDPGGWRAVLAAPKTRWCYLPSPSWPTGTHPDPERAQEAHAAGVHVLSDVRRDGAKLTWLRVPGVPSAETATRLNDPRVQGSTEWSWRDAVLIEGHVPEGLVDW